MAGAVAMVNSPGGGMPISATVVSTMANGSTDSWSDARSFTVTYTITPPGHGTALDALFASRHPSTHLLSGAGPLI
jgi:hypothetical protein